MSLSLSILTAFVPAQKCPQSVQPTLAESIADLASEARLTFGRAGTPSLLLPPPATTGTNSHNTDCEGEGVKTGKGSQFNSNNQFGKYFRGNWSVLVKNCLKTEKDVNKKETNEKVSTKIDKEQM